MLWITPALAVVSVMLFARWVVARNKEGFETVSSCVEQGYPYEFCMRSPLAAIGGDRYCTCADGSISSVVAPGVCSCFPYPGA